MPRIHWAINPASRDSAASARTENRGHRIDAGRSHKQYPRFAGGFLFLLRIRSTAFTFTPLISRGSLRVPVIVWTHSQKPAHSIRSFDLLFSELPAEVTPSLMNSFRMCHSTVRH